MNGQPTGIGESRAMRPENSAPSTNGSGGLSAVSLARLGQLTLVQVLGLEDAAVSFFNTSCSCIWLQRGTHSKKFSPAAYTSMSTSPSRGTGAGISELAVS